jgi:hypothetical protein
MGSGDDEVEVCFSTSSLSLHLFKLGQPKHNINPSTTNVQNTEADYAVEHEKLTYPFTGPSRVATVLESAGPERLSQQLIDASKR